MRKFSFDREKLKKGNGEFVALTIVLVAVCSLFVILCGYIRRTNCLTELSKALNAAARAAAICDSKENALTLAQNTADAYVQTDDASNIAISIETTGEQEYPASVIPSDILHGAQDPDWHSGSYIKVTLDADLSAIDRLFLRGTHVSDSQIVTVEYGSLLSNVSGDSVMIPDSYEGHLIGDFYTNTPHYGTRHWRYDCGRIHAAWVAAGSVYTDNIATINGMSLIACTSLFGEVGDYITWIFEDGYHLETIMADTKSSHDSNYTPYGHVDGDLHTGPIGVIEFETRMNINPRLGHGRPVQAINHGQMY